MSLIIYSSKTLYCKTVDKQEKQEYLFSISLIFYKFVSRKLYKHREEKTYPILVVNGGFLEKII